MATEITIPPTREEPLKIVSSENGALTFDEGNLSTILQGVQKHPEWSNDIPVVAVSIVGPKNSGKTFFTNLLIHYLKAEDEGGWFNRLLTREAGWLWSGNQPNLSGFLWNSVNPSSQTRQMFQPNEEDLKSTGIYLWPEMFVRNIFGERKVIVLVFHLCRGQAETINDVIAMETFLLMACTRMAEIYPVKIVDGMSSRFRLLDARRRFNKSEENICKNIVYILRGVTHLTKNKEDATKEQLKKMIQSAGDKDDMSILETFKEIDIVRLEETSKPLHDEDGRLRGDNPMLKKPNFIKSVTMLMEDPVEPDKLLDNHKIDTENFMEFIKSCVDKVNSLKDRAGELPQTSTETQPGNNALPPESPNLQPPESAVALNSHDENEGHSDIKNNTETGVAEGQHEYNCGESRGVTEELATNVVIDAENIGMDNKDQMSADDIYKAMVANQEKIQSITDDVTVKQNILVALQQEQRAFLIGLNKLKLVPAPEKGDSSQTMHHQATSASPNPNQDPSRPEAKPRTKIGGTENQTENEVNDLSKQKESDEKDKEKTTLDNKDNEETGIAEAPPGQQIDDKVSNDATTEERDKKIRAEEEKKLIQKQKHEEMLEMITKAREELQCLYRPATANWIKIYLNQFNISHIEDVYAEVMNAVLGDFHSKIDHQFWQEFDGILDKEWGEKFKAFLKEFGGCLELFNSEMLKIMANEHHLSRSKLEEIGKGKFAEVLAAKNIPNDDIRKLAQIGCEKLMRIYSSQNDAIYEIINRLVSFHKEEITHFRESDVVSSPGQLVQIQAVLEKKCLDEFRIAFEHINQPGEGSVFFSPDKRLEDLFEFLRKEYFTHLQENNCILKGLHEELSKIIKKSKNSYVEKIEAVLEKHKGGLDETELDRKNKEVSREVMTFLSTEIHKTIRPNEPLDVHEKSLRIYADDYYPTVKDANAKNLKQKSSASSSETKKANLKKPNSPTTTLDNLAEPLGAIKVTGSNNPPKTIEKDATPLPPIIFQLQSKRILVGMLDNGNTEILKNESGEEFTPLIVGLTLDGELCYGKQVQKAVAEAEKGFDSNLKSYWWISDCFAMEKTIWKESILIGNDEHVIRVEFLLGFLLKKLKEHVETDLKEGTCSTAIITVPYWFCSTQRVQVREGAKLAGFADVYLINEASAAALACARSPDRLDPPNNIMVLSENSGKIDATIFSYSENTKKITMLGHCGSYNKEERTKGNIVQETLLQLASKTSSAIGFLVGVVTNPFGAEVKIEDERVVMLRSICKGAIHHAFGSESDTSSMNLSWEVFAISECDTWKTLLTQVCAENAEKFCYMKEQYAAVFGAAIFSNAPQDIPLNISEIAGFTISIVSAKGPDGYIPYKDHLTLPIAKSTIKMAFSSTKRIVEIYEIHDYLVILCSLTVRVPNYTEVLINFRVDRDGIVEWLSVLDKYGQKLSGTYTYSVPTLSSDEFARLQSLLDYVHGQQRSNESLTKAKKELLVKCNEMMSKLEGGETYTIKSSVTKTLFIKRIDDALSIANHPTATLEQIQEQMDGLVTWNSKYQK